MTRISDQGGAAITNMEPGKKGTRAYFDVDDINAGAARVKELGGESSDPMPVPNMGWFATCTDPHGNEFGIWQNDDVGADAGAVAAGARGPSMAVTLDEVRALATDAAAHDGGLRARPRQVPRRPDRLRLVRARTRR